MFGVGKSAFDGVGGAGVGGSGGFTGITEEGAGSGGNGGNCGGFDWETTEECRMGDEFDAAVVEGCV
jgi:hypothetical protein